MIRRPWLLWAMLVCVAFTACSTQRALDTLMAGKAGSVGKWKDYQLGGQPLLETVTMNTALLLAPAEGLEVDASLGDEELQVEFSFAGEMPFGHGSAVPITRDGYFLTASHCLEGPRSALIVFDQRGDTMRVIKADWRTVWQSSNKKQFDLAIIYSPLRLSRAFAVAGAEGLEVEDAVAVAGWSGFTGGTPMASNAAGQIKRISEKIGTLPGPVWWVVGHDAPMHPGDSGGPLVDRQGRLIGIHSVIRVSRRGVLFGSRSVEGLGYVGDAIAPDPAWLKRVIEADRRSRR